MLEQDYVEQLWTTGSTAKTPTRSQTQFKRNLEDGLTWSGKSSFK